MVDELLFKQVHVWIFDAHIVTNFKFHIILYFHFSLTIFCSTSIPSNFYFLRNI